MANQSYRATVASIRSVYGKRLRWQDYRELMSMHSVTEVASYLKNTPAYSELLREIEPAYVHRGYLESVLERSIFERDMHFCKLEQIHDTPFFRFYLMDYEVQEILKAIQFLSDENADYITEMYAWLSPYTCFPLEKLARAKTQDEIVEAVAHTPYAPVLKTFFAENTVPKDFTACEIALRSFYLQQIREDAKKIVKGSDWTALDDFIGEQIDLINLINAYRLKSMFHADADTLGKMMLPVEGKIPKRVMQQLYDAPDDVSFQQILKTTKYGRMLGTGTQGFDRQQMEKAFQTLRYRTAQNALHFSGHAAVSLYAVHFLFQVEVRNLITLIEGIRYGKSVAFMQSHLILEA
ncbi:MAG: V-type ATPase subunit [Ruminococcus sp.]|nr:V-type ATPase subunit [Ruminococcus sp.]